MIRSWHDSGGDTFGSGSHRKSRNQLHWFSFLLRKKQVISKEQKGSLKETISFRIVRCSFRLSCNEKVVRHLFCDRLISRITFSTNNLSDQDGLLCHELTLLSPVADRPVSSSTEDQLIIATDECTCAAYHQPSWSCLTSQRNR